jgi:uncharacterized protein YdiU (UPF0061 family)
VRGPPRRSRGGDAGGITPLLGTPASLEGWDPGFTAAYFDHSGLYAYGRQPLICHHNLRLLQEPLAMLLPRAELEARLERFAPAYDSHYRARLMRRLGFDAAATAALDPERPDPVPLTLQLLASWPVAYGEFFAALADQIERCGLPQDPGELSPFMAAAADPPRETWQAWRDAWWATGSALSSERQATIATTLRRWNLPEPPVRSCIERIWAAIDERDDWQPLHDWLDRCGSSHSAGSGCSALQLPAQDSV